MLSWQPYPKTQRLPSPDSPSKPVLVALRKTLLGELDAWIAAVDPTLTRPEAIRQMIQHVLAEAQHFKHDTPSTAP